MELVQGLEAHADETARFNELVAAFTEMMPSYASTEGLAELRSAPPVLPTPEVDEVIAREIPGGGGPIEARIIVPADVRAVYLHIHGGGWCIGDAKAEDHANSMLAEATGMVTVSVNYRLAPEHPHPDGADDCEAAALWLIESALPEWGTRTLAIGGGSAGAHLAAMTLLRLRDRHGIDVREAFAAANLVNGVYDLGMTPSQRSSDKALAIPRRVLEACYEMYLPGLDAEARRDPALSPLYADLAGMPPALFTVGTADPLLDDSLFFYERWTAADNEARLDVYRDGAHGFPGYPIGIGRAATECIASWLGDHVGRSRMHDAR